MRDLRLSLTDKYSILSFYAECVNGLSSKLQSGDKSRETPCFPGEGNRAFSLMQMKRV